MAEEGQLQDALDTKAAASDVAEEGQLQDALDTKAAAGDVAEKEALQDALDTKAAAGDLADKEELQDALDTKAAASDLADKEELQDALDTKAAASDLADEEQLQDALDTKAAASDLAEEEQLQEQADTDDSSQPAEAEKLRQRRVRQRIVADQRTEQVEEKAVEAVVAAQAAAVPVPSSTAPPQEAATSPIPPPASQSSAGQPSNPALVSAEPTVPVVSAPKTEPDPFAPVVPSAGPPPAGPPLPSEPAPISSGISGPGSATVGQPPSEGEGQPADPGPPEAALDKTATPGPQADEVRTPDGQAGTSRPAGKSQPLTANETPGDPGPDEHAQAPDPIAPSVKDQAHQDLAAAQEAYARPFSETPKLRELWERAAEGRSSFPSARQEFWRLVNDDTGSDAEAVRKLLHTAGFETHPGTTNAATLHVDGYDATRPEDENRVLTDLTLSIDHIDAQAHGGEKLKAENLRFLSKRDNSTRAHRYDTNDQMIDKEYDEDGNRVFERMTADQREFRERVEALLDERRKEGQQ